MHNNYKKSGTVWFYIGLAATAFPIFLIMLLIGSRWFGYLILAVILGAIVYIRYTAFWKGWRIAVCWILTVVISISTAVMCRPSLEISFMATLARETIRLVVQMPAMKNGTVMEACEDLSKVTSVRFVPPLGYSFKRYALDGAALEMLSKKSGDSGNVILQLHGGSYTMGFIDIYRYSAIYYSKTGSGVSVASLDYRTAPENTHPAALEDAVKAWDWLLERGYKAENIIVAGDSAGGGLALALTAWLRDNGREVPGGIICMSPWTDLSCSGPSYEYNLYNDPNFGVNINDENKSGKENLSTEYAGDTELTDPYLSPLFGDFDGFPDMLIQAGTIEMLESDSIGVYDKAVSAGVNVTLTRYEGMFHVFQLMGLLMPESREAWNEIDEFVYDVFQ